MKTRYLFSAIVLSFCVPLIASSHSGQMFTGLGDLAGGRFYSVALGVSDDGSTVVGSGSTASGEEAFRWTLSNGMEKLGTRGRKGGSNGWGVSGDGNTIVGFVHVGKGGINAFRWTQAGGVVEMGGLPESGSTDGIAWSASTDGRIIVGSASHADPAVSEAFRWSEDGGMVGLGVLSGLPIGSWAWDVSGDGSVAVGNSFGSSGVEAFRWTQTGGMVGLGDLNGGDFHSIGYGVSDDGEIVVGEAVSAAGFEAFRWTSSDGMIGLGDLAGGGFNSWANAISGDGNLVAGKAETASGTEAFIWDSVNGMRNLKEVLVGDYGLGRVLSGWTLESAEAVSYDGTTIVGNGTNRKGKTEAWIAKLGEIEFDPIFDSDGDGVEDAVDHCPGTASGEIVNQHGCSIYQAVPIDGNWRNKGEYISAFSRFANDMVKAGIIDKKTKGKWVSEASKAYKKINGKKSKRHEKDHDDDHDDDDDDDDDDDHDDDRDDDDDDDDEKGGHED